MCIFFGGRDDSEQDRRAREALHKSKMKMIDGIRESIENPGTNKTIGNLLKSATSRELALVRAQLERQRDRYYGMGAPIEAGVAERALSAFDKKKYDNGHIARYLTPHVIEKIFG